MRVRAKINLSINTKDGLKNYKAGEEYEVSHTFYKDNRDAFESLEKPKKKTPAGEPNAEGAAGKGEPEKGEPEGSKGEPQVDENAVKELVKSNTRKTLDEKAEKLGINPADFETKRQVAEAIIGAGQG